MDMFIIHIIWGSLSVLISTLAGNVYIKYFFNQGSTARLLLYFQNSISLARGKYMLVLPLNETSVCHAAQWNELVRGIKVCKLNVWWFYSSVNYDPDSFLVMGYTLYIIVAGPWWGCVSHLHEKAHPGNQWCSYHWLGGQVLTSGAPGEPVGQALCKATIPAPLTLLPALWSLPKG